MEGSNKNGPSADKIQNIFSDVASSYDKANNAMTFGLAHLWRKKVVKLSGTPKNGSVLDCATGTGDLAIEFKKHLGPQSKVVGIDFCKEMLDFAPQKARNKKLDIDFKIGDVLALDFKDATFDTVTIAYGIRNVENTVKGLQEMWRTVKPGGKLLILETGEGSGIFSLPIKFYTKFIVPILGGFISKKKHAYSYLSSSSQAFPSKDKFIALTNNLPNVQSTTSRTLLFGASYIYTVSKKAL
jgi:demethylmenaquinone methyltransferase/2-methoxy-6-polyprenyl-1,4-benzoquinol methylase